MKRTHKLIASCAGLAVVAGVAVACFTFLGEGPASIPAKAPANVAASVAAPSAKAVATVATGSTTVGEPQIIMDADFAVAFDTLDQLQKAATVIVKGQVAGISYLDFNGATYTKVTLKVAESLKGKVAAGDQITVMEVGGVTTMAAVKGDKFGAPTKEDAETKVKVLMEGAPLSQVGDNVLYFLGTGSIGVVPGTYYVPLGAYQGRFAIDGGVAKRFVPADATGKYTSLAIDEKAVDSTIAQASAQ
jgi:hypothetical protein